MLGLVRLGWVSGGPVVRWWGRGLAGLASGEGPPTLHALTFSNQLSWGVSHVW